MGVIVDSSVIIAIERQGKTLTEFLRYLTSAYGTGDIALSVVSVVELTHGIYRAKTPATFQRRSDFLEGVFRSLALHSVSKDIAKLAGKIHGEQVSRGVIIGLADLLIGSTAIQLGYSLATLNQKHFAEIPGVIVVGPGVF